jgi:GntR family transcriptional regulator
MVKLEAGPIPLYFQLQQDLLARIRAGELQPGAPLPTEEQLTQAYGVSRITVRRALEALLQEGLISRRRGVGTFVARAPGLVKSVRLSGAVDDVFSGIEELSYKILARDVVEPPPAVRTALALGAAERAVRLEAIARSSGLPFAHAEYFFPAAVGALIGDLDLTDDVPVLRVIERKLGRPVVRTEQTIEPALVDRRQAGHLGVKPRTPVLRIVRTHYVEGHRPVEVVIARYHPERYRCTVQLVARPGPF